MRKLTTLILAMTIMYSCILPAFAAKIITRGDSANATDLIVANHLFDFKETAPNA